MVKRVRYNFRRLLTLASEGLKLGWSGIAACGGTGTIKQLQEPALHHARTGEIAKEHPMHIDMPTRYDVERLAAARDPHSVTVY